MINEKLLHQFNNVFPQNKYIYHSVQDDRIFLQLSSKNMYISI
jgi:hypothetical protein